MPVQGNVRERASCHFGRGIKVCRGPEPAGCRRSHTRERGWIAEMETLFSRPLSRLQGVREAFDSPYTGPTILLSLFAIAAVARLWDIGTTYELFIDEVTYTHIAQNIAAGEGLLLHGETFHLHPPAFFVGLAAAMLGLDLHGDDLAQAAIALRPIPAVIGALTPALVALLLHRVTASWPVAAAGGLLLAVDPFLIRFDSRVLLESQAMAFATAGFLVLVATQQREDDGKPVTWPAVAAGVLMLASLLTKETYAFVTVLPAVILLITGIVLKRRTLGIVLGSTIVGYVGYVLALLVTGQFEGWFEQKTRGIFRLLGLVQITGFNEAGSPSFVDRLMVNLGRFGVTYALIGLGVLATAWLSLLLYRGREVPGASGRGTTLLVIWAVCAQLHLAYALTLGTLEEQMFYLLLVTAVPVLSVAAAAMCDAEARATLPVLRHWSDHTLRTALVAAVGGAMLVNGFVWSQLQATSDDGYARLLEWAETELPAGSRLASTEELTQFIVDHVQVARLETGHEVRRFNADYVLLSTELLAQGYSSADTELLELVEDGDLVFRSQTRTLGSLEVHAVSALTP